MDVCFASLQFSENVRFSMQNQNEMVKLFMALDSFISDETVSNFAALHCAASHLN